MVKGNYPTSTSTALEVPPKPETKISQQANQDTGKEKNKKSEIN